LPDLTAPSPPDAAASSLPDLTGPSSPDAAASSLPDLTGPSSPDAAASSPPDLTAPSPDATSSSPPDLTAPSPPDATSQPLPDQTASLPPAAPTRSSRGPAPPSRPAAPLDALEPESLGAITAEPPAATDEQLREEAFNTAWRFLARRERTEAEVRARLERNDIEPALIDEVLDELQGTGYVDDAGYATRFAEDRRNLDGWGAERIERRLRELGVDRDHVAAALAAGEHDELAAATALLARRYPVPPETPRDREKALGFLVRKGFELELAHDALRRHAVSAVER
jgi:regulatory protein